MVNGEAIYKSRPWTCQNDTLTSGVWYTSNKNNVFAIVLEWPVVQNTLELSSVIDLFNSTNDAAVNLLGYEENLTVI